MIRWITKNTAEILTVACGFGGWTLLTWGIAALTTRWAWALSGGLLLLFLAAAIPGFRLVHTFVFEGLEQIRAARRSPS